MTKQLSIEDVITQMQDMFKDETIQDKPTRLIVNASQMAVVRKMMEGGIVETGKEIFEDEVSEVQQPDHGA